MPSNERTITIEILNKNYQVKCPNEEIAALQQAALFLNDHMQKIRDNGILRDLESIAIMAALNISHDYMQLKNEQSHYINNMGQRIKKLQTRIEEAMIRQEEIDV